MLTREEVERRLEEKVEGTKRLVATGREREALQTALAAMDERDEILTAKKRDSQMAVSYYSKYQEAIADRDALAAEGRLLREALEAHVFHCEIDGQRKSYCEGDYWCSRCSDGDACAVLTIPSLISAEVERVRRLEAVLEAAAARAADAAWAADAARAAAREKYTDWLWEMIEDEN